MNQQLTLGQQLRDEAVDRVDENADRQWKRIAFAAVRWLALKGNEFTTDDVWALVNEHESRPYTHEKRAMGAVMQRAARAGIIVATDRTRASSRPECHANPKRIWRPA